MLRINQIVIRVKLVAHPLGCSTIVLFTSRGFLHDLDLNPKPQTYLPFGCCVVTDV